MNEIETLSLNGRIERLTVAAAAYRKPARRLMARIATNAVGCASVRRANWTTGIPRYRAARAAVKVEYRH